MHRALNAAARGDLRNQAHLAWSVRIGPPESGRSIEWERRLELTACAYALVTYLAVARIDLGAVRLMTRKALRCNPTMRRANVERLLPPVRVTTGRLARSRCGLRCLLSVRVVTGTALSAVGVSPLVEVGQHLFHLMAAEALRCAWNEGASRRIARRQSRHVGSEQVAYSAVPHSLSRHLRKPDGGLLLVVTSGLAARLFYRLKAMQVSAVTLHTLQILQRARV
jgi:hypothetical protein